MLCIQYLFIKSCEREIENVFGFGRSFLIVSFFSFFNTIYSGPGVKVEDGQIQSMEDMDLGFSGIFMEFQAKKKKQKSRIILDGSIHGRARPGKMMAIMGPSGGAYIILLFCVSPKKKKKRLLQKIIR